MSTRPYIQRRHAYWPRLAPTMAIAALLDGGLTYGLDMHRPWEAIVIGLVVGVGVVSGRIAWWRHRHPVITSAEWLRAQRQNAPWN